MKVTYDVELIKCLTHSPIFQEYYEQIDAGIPFPYKDMTFVLKERINEFCKFVENLEFLRRENRLDYIKSIEVDVTEVIFLDELEICLIKL